MFGLFLIFLLQGCALSQTSINKQTSDSDKSAVGIANPASVYCKEQGGTSEIRTNLDGSQTGYCIFSDGSEKEEWEFYRAGRNAE